MAVPVSVSIDSEGQAQHEQSGDIERPGRGHDRRQEQRGRRNEVDEDQRCPPVVPVDEATQRDAEQEGRDKADRERRSHGQDRVGGDQGDPADRYQRGRTTEPRRRAAQPECRIARDAKRGQAWRSTRTPPRNVRADRASSLGLNGQTFALRTAPTPRARHAARWSPTAGTSRPPGRSSRRCRRTEHGRERPVDVLGSLERAHLFVRSTGIARRMGLSALLPCRGHR